MSGSTAKNAIAEASQAFGRGDLAEARRILEPLAQVGDTLALANLGTILALCGDLATYEEGIAIPRPLADAGHGYAAHNLAMALSSPPPGRERDQEAYLHYMGIATDSGFEATVASDPNWWRARPESE